MSFLIANTRPASKDKKLCFNGVVLRLHQHIVLKRICNNVEIQLENLVKVTG